MFGAAKRPMLHRFHSKKLSKRNYQQWFEGKKTLFNEIKYIETQADIRKHRLVFSLTWWTICTWSH